MRADSALSHLHDDERCILTLKDGTQREARWNRKEWRFHFADTDAPDACSFEQIREWRPASINSWMRE